MEDTALIVLSIWDSGPLPVIDETSGIDEDITLVVECGQYGISILDLIRVRRWKLVCAETLYGHGPLGALLVPPRTNNFVTGVDVLSKIELICHIIEILTYLSTRRIVA